MALPASDTFAGTGALSASWTNAVNSLTRVGGIAEVGTDGVDCYAFWNADTFNADQKSSVVLGGTETAGSNWFGATVRASGTGASHQCYVVYTDGSTGAGHFELAKYVGGVYTVLANYGTTLAIGDTLELRVAGTSLSVWKNGVQVGTSSTDSGIASGAAGMYAFHTATSAAMGNDSWTGDNNSNAVTGTATVALKPSLTGVGKAFSGTATVSLKPGITASGTGSTPTTGTGSVALKPTVTTTATNLGTFKLNITINALALAGFGVVGVVENLALKPGVTASGTMTDPSNGAVTLLLGISAAGVVAGAVAVAPTQGGGYPSTKIWPFTSHRTGPKVVTHFVDGKPVSEAPPTPPAAPSSGVGSPKRPIRRRRADLSPQTILAAPTPPLVPVVPPHPFASLLGDLPPVAVPRAPKPPERPAPPPPPKPKKLVIVTRYWGGLGLAMLAQRQGADVVVATDYRTVPAKELKATEKIGHGLVPRLPLEQVKTLVKGDNVLWVFDSNDLPDEADKLRASGELVIGTSALSQQLEEDREFGAEMAKAVGFDLPETEQFHDYAKALQYLEQHADQSFVYKPDAQDPTATYVPLEKEDAAKANRELQEYLKSIHTGNPSFILQEVVNGTEANFETWVSHGVPLVGLCDLESKRKLVGDLGENLGCAGDYVFALGLDSPALAETVLRYLGHPRLRGYTGSVDANVMLKDGKVYFLENCFRFGYNAYGTIFQSLATGAVEDTLRSWVHGDELTGAFKPGFGSSLTLVCDHPKDGTPILIPPEIEQQVYQYRTYCDRDHCAMVEAWPEVAAVTAYGDTMQEAGDACLHAAEEVAFPGKGYRVDLASEDYPTLPIPRYKALQAMGWVPKTEADEFAEISDLMGVL